MFVAPAPRIVKELDFKIIKEDWFVYKLKDGSILKVKPVLVRVFETDQVDPEGKKNSCICRSKYSDGKKS
jgi:hypothetical protein